MIQEINRRTLSNNLMKTFHRNPPEPTYHLFKGYKAYPKNSSRHRQNEIEKKIGDKQKVIISLRVQ